MKALFVEKPETVKVREIPQKELENGMVRIRIEYCLICTWEKRIFMGNGSVPFPFVPGHEASGVVEEVHPGTVTSFKPGDHVVFKTLDHCGHCSACYRGETNLCTGKAKKRTYDGAAGSGGMAQYIDLEPTRIFPVSPDLPLELAAFAEPLACCYHSMMRSSILPGDYVGISGGGIMGQIHGLLALKMGAKVLLIEPDAEKGQHALANGVHTVVNPFECSLADEVNKFTCGEKLDSYIITTPHLSIAEEAFPHVRNSGSIIYYGSFSPKGTISVDPNKIHYSQQVITGSFSPSTEDFFRVSRMLSGGLLDMRPYLNKIFPLQEAEDAFRVAMDPKSYRIGIKLH
ncbi:MAG: alanine dehydrogenase [Spirochaetales bacterium]|nr:MAG: alanine dehydrogenase [Spirochaetales bacterium]